MKRKLFYYIAGSLILGTIISVLYPFIVGGGEMEEFCSAIKPGEMKNELMNRAKGARYSIVESNFDGADMLLIIDSRAMGRYICEVTLQDEQAATTKYVYND
ncbi:hypothetical protein ACFL6N_02910 [Thermodesulfobacteriota bacterium]